MVKNEVLRWLQMCECKRGLNETKILIFNTPPGFTVISYYRPLQDDHGQDILQLSQFLQFVLMVDFFWYYITAVKNATPLLLPSSNAGNMV